MMRKIKQFFINYKEGWKNAYIAGFVFFLIGGGMIETAILDFQQMDAKNFWMMIAFGLFFGLPGVMLVAGSIVSAIPGKEQIPESEEKNIQKESRFAKSLRVFREVLNAFFENPRQIANDPIQGYVTQVYFRILSLQKRRLADLGITLHMDTKEMQYAGEDDYIPMIRERNYDDGKYKIAIVKQQICGIKTFSAEDKQLYQVRANQVANYTLLTAFQRGKDNVVCPSCGNTTTRENLLDGCDYCHSKFMIEDLGEKVQDFSFRSDYAVEYAKYRKARSWMWRWGFILGGIPGAVFMTVVAIKTYFEGWMLGNRIGPFIGILGGLMAVVFMALVSTIILSFILWFLIFPVVQTIAGINYRTKKQIQTAKEKASRDTAAEESVRRFDVRFSLQGFYGNIENKLAGIHFANSEKEINAYATIDLSHHLPMYQKVVDMEVDSMSLEDYTVQNGLQHAKVLVNLQLLQSDGRAVKKKTERIALDLIKSADCKTQAVTGPELIRCKGCGASISLLEGKRCQYCGGDIPLFEHDWVITGYEVKIS